MQDAIKHCSATMQYVDMNEKHPIMPRQLLRKTGHALERSPKAQFAAMIPIPEEAFGIVAAGCTQEFLPALQQELVMGSCVHVQQPLAVPKASFLHTTRSVQHQGAPSFDDKHRICSSSMCLDVKT